jgi:8-oxo-dGTP pyrophosphatase MutT (NUDIX family)
MHTHLLTFVKKVRRFYWWLVRPHTKGVRGIIITGSEVLLVRHTYQSGWYFPGGGIKKSENPSTALGREIIEECGFSLGGSKVTLLGEYTSNIEYKVDTIQVFVCLYDKKPVANTRSYEIEHAEWFPLTQLPDSISPATRRRIQEYLGNQPISPKW